MRYIPITCEQRAAMLRAVGVPGTDELFRDIPATVRLGRPLDLEEGMSEIELSRHVRGLADRNTAATALVSFAGAGVYEHYIPAVVDHIIGRPEFFTAYTPYQPEVSQGTLQAMFEFQTCVCELTGMDVTNASLYDGATALVEASFMAARVTKRSKIVVSEGVHPQWLETLDTYASTGTVEIVRVGLDGGTTDVSRIAESATDAAAVLVASPNFLGGIEDLEALGTVAHDAGALFVVATDPILLGVMESPGSFGADIVVAEGQSLGSPMSFGGPGLGLFACRKDFVRQMPGRVVGRTVDVDGEDAYVLTLSTREQHIRRERATSNICSNHALNAIAAGAYLAAVGSAGLEGIAGACVAKAHYLHDELLGTGRFKPAMDYRFGYEFALRYGADVPEMQRSLRAAGYIAGIDLGRDDSKREGLVLFAVTEQRTREEIDAFVAEVNRL